jgi:hypothetical protein
MVIYPTIRTLQWLLCAVGGEELQPATEFLGGGFSGTVRQWVREAAGTCGHAVP